MQPLLPARFSVRISTNDGDSGAADIVEEFAAQLRAELDDPMIVRIEAAQAGPALAGTRGFDVLDVLEFVITAVDAGQAVVKAVDAIRAVARRLGRRARHVEVNVGDTAIDLLTASDEDIRRAITTVLTRLSTHAGVRSALIIANARFDHPSLQQLRSPAVEAGALAAALGDPAIGGFDVIQLIDADERAIRRSLDDFFNDRNRDDLLLVYYSGHGIKDFRGSLHLAARDTEVTRLAATSVSATYLSDRVDQSQSRRVVLILDCCYSGAYRRGTTTRADDQAVYPEGDLGGTGRIVLTASSATEYAFDGPELADERPRPSPFTGALIDGLTTGEADLDGDGDISVDELYTFVYQRVRQIQPGQTPRRSIDIDGTVVIAHSARTASLPVNVREDLDHDRPEIRLTAVAALTRLMQHDKSGMRAAAIDALLWLRDNDDSVRVRTEAVAALGSLPITTTAAAFDGVAVGPTAPAVDDNDGDTPSVPVRRTPAADPADPVEIGEARVSPSPEAAPIPVPSPDSSVGDVEDIAVDAPAGRRRRRVRAVAATGLAVVLVAAVAVVMVQFGGVGQGHAQATPACGYRIAFLGALSGSEATLGVNVERGAELAVDMFNAKHGANCVRLGQFDSQGDASMAAAAARSIVADKTIVGVVGPLFSAESATANPILNDAGIPLITPSATDPALASGGAADGTLWTVFHRAVASDDDEGAAAALYATQVLHSTKVFVADDQSVYGSSIAEAAKATLGGNVVGTDKTGPDGKVTDFSGTVNKIVQSGATAVFYGGYYTNAGLLRKQLSTAGWKGTLIGGDAVDDPGFISAATPAYAEGSVFLCPCPPVLQATGSFLADYSAKWGAAAGVYSDVAFDAANMFLQAISAGNTTPAKVNAYLKTINYHGVANTYRFLDNGNLAPSDAQVWAYRVRGGQVVPDQIIIND